MAIGGTVYIVTNFFKEISCDGLGHLQEDCHHDLLYWPLHTEPFSLEESQCVST